ncbi:MAG: hypothetical protein IJ151_04710 [Bacteroidales bacterium]|nr:hypothetical protein [Bacteroidales bacterium]
MFLTILISLAISLAAFAVIYLIANAVSPGFEFTERPRIASIFAVLISTGAITAYTYLRRVKSVTDYFEESIFGNEITGQFVPGSLNDGANTVSSGAGVLCYGALAVAVLVNLFLLVFFINSGKRNSYARSRSVSKVGSRDAGRARSSSGIRHRR